MVTNERWRSAGCALNIDYATTTATTTTIKYNKLFIKFKPLQSGAGYEVFISDFNGHLWQERLEGSGLQDRLKSEASGLEIETADLLKLLEQMCQNFAESSCETMSDFKDLILRASVKIGFIKLKWTFKTEICEPFQYNEMIRKDFLIPFFANLRDDKIMTESIEDKELTSFYENVLPSLQEPEIPIQRPIEEIISFGSTDLNSPTTTELPLPTPIQKPAPTLPEPNYEELKRKELEEQLQLSKKKKKKLI